MGIVGHKLSKHCAAFILIRHKLLTHRMCVCVRYSVRAEGDAVREHDRILLESCRFKVGDDVIQ